MLTTGAQAYDEADVVQVERAVRSRFSDFQHFCTLPEAERRQAVVREVMPLASSGRMNDPAGAGMEVGARLRKACGLDGTAMTLAQLRWLATAKPLTFDSERRRISAFTSAESLANRVFAPEGDGPFPAVVISQTKSMSRHLLVAATALVDAGFAVLAVDTFGPRGFKAGVNEPLPAEPAKDAYDALAHLRSLPWIDKERIYQTGFSYGAMASALLASPAGAEAFKAAGRFRATVGHYGTCRIASPSAGGQARASYIDLLSADSDRPLLMLMAERDIETPPAECFPLLDDMRAAGKPVEWHIYPGATHGWDKAENDGYVFRTASGQSMSYRYDAALTQDAMQRTIAFFNRYR